MKKITRVNKVFFGLLSCIETRSYNDDKKEVLAYLKTPEEPNRYSVFILEKPHLIKRAKNIIGHNVMVYETIFYDIDGNPAKYEVTEMTIEVKND